MTALILRGDARALPLPDSSVDLAVTSPPYWNLRAYEDGGRAYDGQIGAEPTPAEYIANLLDVTRECARVLKPTGSLFINIGDSYANRATPERIGSSDETTSRGTRPARPTTSGTGIRPKSLNGLPWRFALACVDDLGLILRRDIIWQKLNPIPESVTDRARSSHEYLFHVVKEHRYFAAVDEVREPHVRQPRPNEVLQMPGGELAGQRAIPGRSDYGHVGSKPAAFHPLGRLPGSVWEFASEPFRPPAISPLDGRPLPQHFAAYPTALVRRIILGWSPGGICAACGEGRRPAVDREAADDRPGRKQGRERDALAAHGADGRHGNRRTSVATITGYACACPTPDAPARPAVILDPFGGTGTTALVASVLGRIGISVDASHDYARLARWRTTDPGQRAKAAGLPKPKITVATAGQIDMFEVTA